MKKRVLIILMIILMLIIIGTIVFFLLRDKEEPVAVLKDHRCKETPLIESCLEITQKPDYNDTINYGIESVFDETFTEDFINSQPFSWLLYRSDTYKIGAVDAEVYEGENNNKYVSLYSDGKHRPLYNPADRSLIFTRQFNLDEKGYGVVEGELFLPKDKNNEVYFEVASGAVNVLGINVKKDGKLSVISGGVFHNYQGTVDIIDPQVTLLFDTWYKFRLEWNRELDIIKASMYDSEGNLITLHEGIFHISVRESAKRDGEPVVPNIVRFTMPYLVNREGFVYVDNIRVDSAIESEE